ncbi:2-oxoglutarate dehydrogenase, E2 component, dihydrolipoamide succinyltransferase [Phytoactinopolyspora halotolerans]|uniref:Dihydrolipoamide acetyltransferase component of pyruvate dehydrogenase complex n=1 Tax=Phytoactinopolyspora halotolerans TaxID=1981512 RepID=A0A6L9S9J7_9ACTN|nr:2-oxoglutarate dehydrogenase, E2 component, dihydrolipoamide succinyltransferase [Phytoactinopolyspora halotolerans]NEE01759.1 2-oxoglutarate dehydrogenase, E2 component, dihydrolipoamide succinyltransferase [Phytoactinopolyspora halotolerans]
MATSVTLPALGESVTEGTVTRWLKQPGDQVAVDEPLLEISTDKVDTEIPSPVAGVLQEIKVGEDETVEVGAELAIIGEEGAAPAAEPEPQQQAPQQAQEPQQEAPEPEAPPQPESAPPPAEESQPQEQASQQAPAGGGTPVTLPALGESVTEGTVTRWLKQPGDQVAVDEPLLEISTDKVDTEIPSPVAGVLQEIKVGEDETVEVGAELAIIGEEGAAPAAEPEPQQQAPQQAQEPQQEAPQQAQEPQQQAPQPQAPAAEQTPTPQPERAPAASEQQPPQAAQQPSAAAPSGDGAPYVTPLVRKLAAEHGVDLSTVTGSGVGGRIRKQDVLAAAEAAKAAEQAPAAPAAEAPSAGAPSPVEPSPLRGTRQKMSRIRKAIAEHMVNSLATSAQLTTVIEVDITRIARLRDRAKKDFQAREGVKLSFLPFFAKAAVEALKVYPIVNASVDGDEIVYHDTENLGIAVDTERGLMVPVVKNAGDLNIGGLARQIADLAERTRTNKLKPDDIAGGTFTLTNTGSRGALFDTPILNQPQVGMLGTGAVVKRPVVVTDDTGADNIAIRSMVYLALSYDHRIIDGADAARYLSAVKQRLEEGQFEGELGL